MKYKSFGDLSIAIGWEYKTIPYPTIEEVEKAIKDNNEEAILRWHRFTAEPDKKHKAVADLLKSAMLKLVESYKGTENKNTWDNQVKDKTDGRTNVGTSSRDGLHGGNGTPANETPEKSKDRKPV